MGCEHCKAVDANTPRCDTCDDTGWYTYMGSPEVCLCVAGQVELANARAAAQRDA